MKVLASILTPGGVLTPREFMLERAAKAAAQAERYCETSPEIARAFHNSAAAFVAAAKELA